MRQLVEHGELPWEYFADDFVWDMSNVAWTERKNYVGREGMTEFVQDWTSNFEDWNMEPLEFVVVGDQMVIVLQQTATARASGVPVDMTFAQVWSGNARTLKLTRMRMFGSREEAIAVAEAETANASFTQSG